MAFRVAGHVRPDPLPKVRAAKKSEYLKFLHALPCVVSGKYGVQAAHLSFANPYYLHYGRGKGSKADDRWALPLNPDAHREQHSTNERDWWASQGINPHELALILYGAWSAMGDDAEPFCAAKINQGLVEAGRYERCAS